MNASPLIALGSVGRMELLVQLAETLLIPRAVAQEVSEGAPEDAARNWLEGPGARHIVDTRVEPSVLEWNIGAGETAVLSHALALRGAESVVDDRSARRAAKALGVPVIGTVAVVAAAKVLGLIPAARPILDELTAKGFRVTPEVLEAALRRVGEDRP